MLNAFEFANFQSFEWVEGEPVHRIELSKLNLIYGPNSSGKSSILRALKFVGKNLQNQTLPSTETWDFDIDGLSLGNFQNVVSRHEFESRDIVFSFEFFKRIEIEKTTSDSLLGMKGFFKSLGIDNSRELLEQSGHYGQGWFNLRFKVILVMTHPGRIRLLTIEVLPYVLDPEGPIGQGFGSAFKSVEEEGKFVWEFASTETKTEFLQSLQEVATVNGLLTKHRSNQTNFEVENSNRLDGIDMNALEQWVTLGSSELWINDGRGNQPSPISTAFRELNVFIETSWGFLQDSLSYFDSVSPLREIPGVIQVKTSPLFKEIQSRLNLVEEFSLVQGFLKDYLEQPREWFRRITNHEFDFEIKNLEIPGSNETFGLWALSKNSRTSFENVGVGLSQVLPVLFALFPYRQLGNNRMTRCIYLQQPELHLHPKMQGDLADAMIAAINSDLVSIQLFVETHSEALILRLLRRIKDGSREGIVLDQQLAFSQNDISVNYVSKSEGRSLITSARVSADGEMLDPWPLNFADLRISELFS
jgi:predicted ATPase